LRARTSAGGWQRHVAGPLPSRLGKLLLLSLLVLLSFFALLALLGHAYHPVPDSEVNDLLTSGVNISLTDAGCRYAVLVTSKSFVRRIAAALGALDVADGPVSRLDAARRLREAAEELEAAQVEAARKAGVTWSEIGSCYGLTKQGAQQRFRAARHQAKAGTKLGVDTQEARERRAGPEPG
jgi:molybdenum cofactor biosynthesis enzyme